MSLLPAGLEARRPSIANERLSEWFRWRISEEFIGAALSRLLSRVFEAT